jgi:hypothetical protein
MGYAGVGGGCTASYRGLVECRENVSHLNIAERAVYCVLPKLDGGGTLSYRSWMGGGGLCPTWDMGRGIVSYLGLDWREDCVLPGTWLKGGNGSYLGVGMGTVSYFLDTMVRGVERTVSCLGRNGGGTISYLRLGEGGTVSYLELNRKGAVSYLGLAG